MWSGRDCPADLPLRELQRRADGAAGAHERAGHGGMRRGCPKIGTLLKREGIRHDMEMLYRVYLS